MLYMFTATCFIFKGHVVYPQFKTEPAWPTEEFKLPGGQSLDVKGHRLWCIQVYGQ